MGNKSSRSDTGSNKGAGENDELEENSPSQHKQSGSYYSMIKQSYSALVNAIIRPPRCDYETSQLGPRTFQFCGRTIERHDFDLVNARNLKFVCSMWEPIESDRPSKLLPCVIYMHGNSSSRLEALSSLSLVLSLGVTLLSLDFCGSGKSEGEYVSLGAYEKDDLERVIQYLRETGKTSTIALWGRSMGASTALFYGERDPSIAGMVLDSAFADLVMLAEEMVDKGREKGLFAPGFVVRLAIRFVRSSVLKAAHFDIKTLSPIEHASSCFIPALFIAAEGDAFVNKSHSEKIYEQYGGDKNIIIVEGDHNSARPFFLYDSVSIFLINTLQIPQEWILPEGASYTRKYPWTYKSPRGGNRQGGGHNAMSEVAYGDHLGQGSSSNSEMMMDFDDMALEEVLALSLLEAQGFSEKQGSATSGDETDELPYLGEDAEMQHEVQSRLYNLLSHGGGGGSGSTDGSARSKSGQVNRHEKAPPPLSTSKSGSHDTVHELGVTHQHHGSINSGSSGHNSGSGSGGGSNLIHSAMQQHLKNQEVQHQQQQQNLSLAKPVVHIPVNISGTAAANTGSRHKNTPTAHPVRPEYSHSSSASTVDSQNPRDMLLLDSYDCDDEASGKAAQHAHNSTVGIAVSPYHHFSPQNSPTRDDDHTSGPNTGDTGFEVVQVAQHPKTLVNKALGADSSFNKIFGSDPLKPLPSGRAPLSKQLTLASVDLEGPVEYDVDHFKMTPQNTQQMVGSKDEDDYTLYTRPQQEDYDDQDRHESYHYDHRDDNTTTAEDDSMKLNLMHQCTASKDETEDGVTSGESGGTEDDTYGFAALHNARSASLQIQTNTVDNVLS